MVSVFQKFFRRKVLDKNEVSSELKRILTTLDLTMLGIGSTLGLGIYVLAGSVAKLQAGPAVVLSFFVAAAASVLAGLCYAEFGARVPKAGSAYIYSYVCVGELIAFIVGWNLIMEYVIGVASVARGYSGYVDSLFDKSMQHAFRSILPIDIEFISPYIDFFAFGITLVLTVILACGVKESSIFNNIFTGLNLIVVLFVIVVGSIKASPSNWALTGDNHTNSSNANINIVKGEVGTGGFAPFGFAGVMAGAAKCFYGFVGFDCIATTGEEAKNPQRAIPLAIIFSLLFIFLAYFGISTVLTMMVPYYLQDPDAPLPYAFSYVGLDFAKWVVSIGALFGLSTSLLGAMFPLPRVIFSMARDGLLFNFLAKVHPRFQTPFVATIISGTFGGSFSQKPSMSSSILYLGLMAAMFNLDALIDMMSIGTLTAYTLVAICVLILRYRKDEGGEDDVDGVLNDDPTTTGSYLKQMFNSSNSEAPTNLSTNYSTLNIIIYCILTICFCALAFFGADQISNGNPIVIICLVLVGAAMILLLSSLHFQPVSRVKLSFKVPFVPIIPGLSVVANVYLIMQLGTATWLRFGVWMVIGFIIYGYCLISGNADRGFENQGANNESFEGDNGRKYSNVSLTGIKGAFELKEPSRDTTTTTPNDNNRKSGNEKSDREGKDTVNGVLHDVPLKDEASKSGPKMARLHKICQNMFKPKVSEENKQTSSANDSTKEKSDFRQSVKKFLVNKTQWLKRESMNSDEYKNLEKILKNYEKNYEMKPMKDGQVEGAAALIVDAVIKVASSTIEIANVNEVAQNCLANVEHSDLTPVLIDEETKEVIRKENKRIQESLISKPGNETNLESVTLKKSLFLMKKFLEDVEKSHQMAQKSLSESNLNEDDEKQNINFKIGDSDSDEHEYGSPPYDKGVKGEFLKSALKKSGGPETLKVNNLSKEKMERKALEKTQQFHEICQETLNSEIPSEKSVLSSPLGRRETVELLRKFLANKKNWKGGIDVEFEPPELPPEEVLHRMIDIHEDAQRSFNAFNNKTNEFDPARLLLTVAHIHNSAQKSLKNEKNDESYILLVTEEAKAEIRKENSRIQNKLAREKLVKMKNSKVELQIQNQFNDNMALIHNKAQAAFKNKQIIKIESPSSESGETESFISGTDDESENYLQQKPRSDRKVSFTHEEYFIPESTISEDQSSDFSCSSSGSESPPMQVKSIKDRRPTMAGKELLQQLKNRFGGFDSEEDEEEDTEDAEEETENNSTYGSEEETDVENVSDFKQNNNSKNQNRGLKAQSGNTRFESSDEKSLSEAEAAAVVPSKRAKPPNEKPKNVTSMLEQGKSF